MIFFVTVLRALAAMIITNAHYVGVYPTDLIANGGLLGDVIFFAVSGFCLANPKLGFFRWYGKRISRIYPQVWLVTLLYALIGIFFFCGVGRIRVTGLSDQLSFCRIHNGAVYTVLFCIQVPSDARNRRAALAVDFVCRCAGGAVGGIYFRGG